MTMHALIQLTNTEATRLTPPGLHSGMDITIQNINSEGYIYVGGEGVNQEDFGYRISPNNGWSIELPGADALYAIADTNGAYAAVLKTNVESGS